MGNCKMSHVGADFQIPQLEPKNSYGTCDSPANEAIARAIFPVSYDTNRRLNVPDLIQKDRNMLFDDPKFSLSTSKSLRLSVLFNFASNSSRIFRRNEQTDITSFVQLNIEFAYLTSVFYHLSRRDVKNKLLPQLVENMETNPYGAYCCYLHCNGQKQLVIIDDRMPTQNDNFLYLRVVKGIQLWPLLLEKAWCKMISSYENALGLSPEDAFEEITGVPCFTYTIRANNRQVIRSVLLNAMRNKYWVTLVARNGLTDLQNRQVFYLQSIDLDQYTIISPYVSYAFERYSQKRRGEVVVREQDIFSHFEHVIVGFYHEGYVPVTLPVKMQARQEIVFELTIKKRQDISIRFNQLYKGYFKPGDRNNYEYSPVLMELYEITMGEEKRKCKLLDYCQGCTRSIVGSRSSECSVNIMERLEGKYLVRLEVDWRYDGVINEGNLVVYASENNVQLTQMRNSEILFKEVYPDIFQHDGTNSIILHEHNLEVHTFDKEKTTLIEFHNVTSSTHHFKADFNRSRNVMLRGKEIRGDQAFIRLKADEKTIIEVLPLELNKRMEIENFQIHKLEIKE